jgi:hypothetical protein
MILKIPFEKFQTGFFVSKYVGLELFMHHHVHYSSTIFNIGKTLLL